MFLKRILVCTLSLVAFVAQSEERVTLRAHYGLITAGKAELVTVKSPDGTEEHSNLTFRTTNMVDKLFRFVYVLDSRYAFPTCYPHEFAYRLDEKKQTYSDTIFFHQAEKYLDSNRHGQIAFEQSPRDVLSAIAWLRAVDWSGVHEGDSVQFDMVFREKRIFPVSVCYQGRETVKVGACKYACIKLQLTSEAGALFVSDSKMTIYLSDDENRVPVSLSVDVFLGAFKLDMTDCEGVKYPLRQVE